MSFANASHEKIWEMMDSFIIFPLHPFPVLLDKKLREMPLRWCFFSELHRERSKSFSNFLNIERREMIIYIS